MLINRLLYHLFSVIIHVELPGGGNPPCKKVKDGKFNLGYYIHVEKITMARRFKNRQKISVGPRSTYGIIFKLYTDRRHQLPTSGKYEIHDTTRYKA